MTRRLRRRARRALAALGLLTLALDVAVALIWRSWCGRYAADEAALDALGRSWP